MSVILGYIHANTVANGFMESVLNLTLGSSVGIKGVINERGTPNSLGEARNGVTRKFLDHTQADWLWFVDTDIIFSPETLDRLLAHEKPIVSANYRQVQEIPATYGWRTQPLAYQWVDGVQDMQPFKKYEGLMEVDVVGAGCLLIHRDVFEDIDSDIDSYHEGLWWSQIGEFGEDVSFCARVADYTDHKIHFAADLKVLHQKTVWV